MKIATETDASSAPAGAREIEVELPEGLTLPELDADAARVTASAAVDELAELRESAERPAVSPSRSAASDRAPMTDRERQLLASRNEERGKRKTLAEKYRDLQAENDRLKATQPANVPTPRALVRETKEQRAERIAKLKRAAGEKDLIADVVELVVDHLDQRVEERLEALDSSFVRTIDATKAQVDEKIFRATHEDYDDVLTRAGLFEALQIIPGTQQFKDPVIARKVYTSPNYARTAYEIAQQKLAYEAEQAEGRGERPAQDSERRTAAPGAIETAEERGRREAFETVATNANRGRGIRHLPASSGPRRAVISHEYLDDLMERDFPRYEALMEANPQLRVFHLS